jgi:tRNA threonylcarbamoyladenosine biosynthesis protein TsaB
MTILALETTGDLCSVAVQDTSGLLVERVFRHRMHLSERLVGDVDALLADAGTNLASIDAFAVGIGPGSFTGVRLGVMTAKTWANILGKPIVGVNALDALAWEAGPWPGIVVPVIRARPGAVYASIYRPTADGPIPDADPALLTAPELVERIAGYGEAPVLLLGDGLKKTAAELESSLNERGITPAFGPTDAPRASTLAAIAVQRLANGQADDALALVPLYVSPPPIDPRAEVKVKQSGANTV